MIIKANTVRVIMILSIFGGNSKKDLFEKDFSAEVVSRHQGAERL